jgi:hypothetical protein
MRVTERPFSDLLRHPKDVALEVDEGDIVLRRRDEPDLRLTRADRETERAAAFAAFGRTLRNLAVHNPGALADALGDAFPWLEFLPVVDRRAFVEEFSRVAAAAAELDTYAPMSQLVREWRATAEIHADPKLARRLRRPTHAAGGRVVPARRVVHVEAT